MNEYFSAKELLMPPTERAAFSDRQAYVCAELSRLAYSKFEGRSTVENIAAGAKTLLTGSLSSEHDSKNTLREILGQEDFELVKTFSAKGTQAFICLRKIAPKLGGKGKVMAFLVFRGADLTDFADIKTIVKAKLIDVEVGGMEIQMHGGYAEAFESVREDVEAVLASLQYDQLFLTGHSLGGALAIVATRLLASDAVGACYTFGAPPVGTADVSNNLKTPVFEIINEVDIVPRLPNPWMSSVALGLIKLMRLRLLGRTFTFVGKILGLRKWADKLEAFMEMALKYRHPGYLSYLVGSGNRARIRYNVNFYDRLKWWVKVMWKSNVFGEKGFRKMASDHSIDLYVEKLIVHGQRRQ